MVVTGLRAHDENVHVVFVVGGGFQKKREVAEMQASESEGRRKVVEVDRDRGSGGFFHLLVLRRHGLLALSLLGEPLLLAATSHGCKPV